MDAEHFAANMTTARSQQHSDSAGDSEEGVATYE